MEGAEFRSKVQNGSKIKKNVWLVDCLDRNVKQLKELKFEISEMVKESSITKEIKLVPINNVEGLNATLYSYQAEALGFIKATKGKSLLAMSPGTGKTLTSLAYIKLIKKQAPKTLIIVLSSVKIMWEKETKKWIGEDSQVLYSKKPYAIDENIVIINFDIVDAWKKELKAYKFDNVIIDEIHCLANPKSKRTKAVKSICSKATTVLGLTGTPIKSRPAQLFSPLQIINGDIFQNQRSFERRYCKGYQSQFGWNASGSSNSKELHDILKENVMYRIRKQDVFDDVPKINKTRIPVDINRKEYDRIKNDFENWLKANGKATIANVLTQISPLRQEAVMAKLKATEEWIEEFLKSGEKLVVFCVHKKIVQALMKKFGKVATKIDGSLSAQKKEDNKNKFVNDVDTKLMIGNIQSLSTGVDGMQHACNNMLFVENTYLPSDKEQSICRLDRIGQKYSVNCYDIISVDTIDGHILDIIEKKQKIIDSVVEGNEVKQNSDVVGDLLKMFK
tara:strand:+ start:3356 stop:4870 length:1515 start_codon:yes stop_codon:yes gene_type:complete